MTEYVNYIDEEIFLYENDSIETVFLYDNKSLKRLVVKNCSKLKEIILGNNEDSEIFIEDCDNLIEVSNFFTSYDTYTKSITISKGCNNLTNISLKTVENVFIQDQPLSNLTKLYFFDIKNLRFNLNICPNLKKVDIISCKSDKLELDSDNLEVVELVKNNIGVIHFKGNNDKLKLLNINSNFKELIVDKVLSGIRVLKIFKKCSKFPYLPLPDKIDKNLIFYVSLETSYHPSVKDFIYNNIEQIFLVDKFRGAVEICDVKFYNI